MNSVFHSPTFFKSLCCFPFLNLFFHKKKYFHCINTTDHKAPRIGIYKKGSWIDFYKKTLIFKKGNDLSYFLEGLKCCFEGCSNDAIVGAHLRKSYSIISSSDWYIGPSCKECNNKRGMASQIKKGTYLIKVSSGHFFKKRTFIKFKKKDFRLSCFLHKIKIRKI